MSDPQRKSISQLEGWTWNIDVPMKNNSSYEEYNFYLLHNKPLKEYSVEDLYFMIGQDTGLIYLVPIAIEILDKDLLVKADDFPGDLLCRVLNLKIELWGKLPRVYYRLNKLLKNNKVILENSLLSKDIKILIDRSIKSFSLHRI